MQENNQIYCFINEVKQFIKTIIWCAKRTLFKKFYHIRIDAGSNTKIAKSVQILPYVRLINRMNGSVEILDKSIICDYTKIIHTGKGMLKIGGGVLQ